MRAHRAVLIAVVSVGVMLCASSARAQGMGFGVKAGPNFSTFHQADENFQNNTGFQGGLFLGGNRHGIWGTQWEALYARKGTKQGSSKTTIDSLEIPILLRLNGTPGNKYVFSPYALVGPVLDVKLKAEQDGRDVGDDYQSADLGLLAGGGFELARFLVEGRYTWGLRNISTLAGGTSSEIRTRSFAVMAGYRFSY